MAVLCLCVSVAVMLMMIMWNTEHDWGGIVVIFCYGNSNITETFLSDEMCITYANGLNTAETTST